MRFAKAHGLGNDFLLVEADDAPSDAGAWARRLCERHTGVGADGVLLYRVVGNAQQMRLLNADGSDGDLSGNGIRCLAAWAVSRGWLPASHVVETPRGPRAVTAHALQGSRWRVRTDLGPPALASAEIPMLLDPPLPSVVGATLEAAGGSVRVTATSMGNPHCTLLLDRVADDALVGRLGPALERHPLFPRRTNVEFATPVGPEELRVRFWERGVGPTRASGTGSAAAAVAAILEGRVERRLRVVCDGGELEIEWPEDGPVLQTGEVELLVEGEWLA